MRFCDRSSLSSARHNMLWWYLGSFALHPSRAPYWESQDRRISGALGAGPWRRAPHSDVLAPLIAQYAVSDKIRCTILHACEITPRRRTAQSRVQYPGWSGSEPHWVHKRARAAQHISTHGISAQLDGSHTLLGILSDTWQCTATAVSQKLIYARHLRVRTCAPGCCSGASVCPATGL